MAARGRRTPPSLREAIWPQRVEPPPPAHGAAPPARPQILPRALEELPEARPQKGLPLPGGTVPRRLPPGQVRQQVEEDRRRGPRPHPQAPRQVVGGLQGKAAQTATKTEEGQQQQQQRRGRGGIFRLYRREYSGASGGGFSGESCSGSVRPHLGDIRREVRASAEALLHVPAPKYEYSYGSGARP